MSSIASSLAELAKRIERMLDEASRAGLDSLASDLAVVERSIIAARRKLDDCVGR
jgi:hypothetical protein